MPGFLPANPPGSVGRTGVPFGWIPGLNSSCPEGVPCCRGAFCAKPCIEVGATDWMGGCCTGAYDQIPELAGLVGICSSAYPCCAPRLKIGPVIGRETACCIAVSWSTILGFASVWGMRPMVGMAGIALAGSGGGLFQCVSGSGPAVCCIGILWAGEVSCFSADIFSSDSCWDLLHTPGGCISRY